MAKKITDLTNMNGAATIDRTADLWEIVDLSGNTSYKATPNFVLGFTGGNPVSTSDTQTLTNKTITAPTISAPVLSGTITGTYTIGGTPTFPSSVATLTGSQTLTNKTITSPAITGGSLTNATVSIDSIAEFTSANGVTVDGMNIKDGKLNTNNSVVATNITDAAVTPAKLVAGSGTGWAWQSWTPTWTNLTPGNGVNSSKYTQIGKTVFFTVDFVLGTTSSVGTGPIFSLPLTSAAITIGFPVAWGRILDSGTGYFNPTAELASTTTAVLKYWDTNNAAAGITASAPMVWTNPDSIWVMGWFQAA